MKNNLLKSLAVFALTLLFSVSALADKNVIFIWDPGKANDNEGVHPSQVNADLLASELGYTVTIFTNADITGYSEEEMDQFKAADLIIIDRGLGSWNWSADARPLWNALETPILNMNPWSARFAQKGWFEGTEVQYWGGDDVINMVKVSNPEDAIFEGIELDEDGMFGLWIGNIDVMPYEVDYPGTGDHLLTFEREEGDNPITVLTRFAAGVEFFEGGETPAGPRTYFAMGKDNGGNAPYNYFGFTDDGKKVYLAEVKRLATYEGGPVNVVPVQAAKVSIAPNPASNNVVVSMNNLSKVEIWDLTGKLISSFVANGQELSVDISNLSAGIYFVKAVDANNNAVVEKLIKK